MVKRLARCTAQTGPAQRGKTISAGLHAHKSIHPAKSQNQTPSLSLLWVVAGGKLREKAAAAQVRRRAECLLPPPPSQRSAAPPRGPSTQIPLSPFSKGFFLRSRAESISSNNGIRSQLARGTGPGWVVSRWVSNHLKVSRSPL